MFFSIKHYVDLAT